MASAPGVGLAGSGDALGLPVVCSAGRSGAVVSLLVLLFVALWLNLQGDLFSVLPCVVLFLCFSGLFALRLPRLGREGWESWSWCFSCVCSISACLVLSVSSSSWCLGKAAVCDCGTPWTFLLPFLPPKHLTG